MKFSFKELALYFVAAATSLFILGFSVHMIVGNMVSPEMEKMIIGGACFLGVCLMAFMGWDIKKRRGNS